jgi:hypothetical protein
MENLRNRTADFSNAPCNILHGPKLLLSLYLIALGILLVGCGRSTPRTNLQSKSPHDSSDGVGSDRKHVVAISNPVDSLTSQFRSGNHQQAIFGLGQHRQSDATAATDIELWRKEILWCNLAGFRGAANRQVRRLIRTQTPTWGELIGITHPDRPWVEFSAKPSLEDPKDVRKCGLLSILYALQLRGDACGTVDAIKRHPQFLQREPETYSMLAYILSVCQRDVELEDTIVEMPPCCRESAAYWIAIGNLAGENGYESIKPLERAYLFRSALRIEPNHLIACKAALSAITETDPAVAKLAETKSLIETLITTQDVILESQWLVNELSVDGPNSATLVLRLCELYERSGRSLESVAWKIWLLSQSTQPRNTEFNAYLAALSQTRQQIVAANEEGCDWQKMIGQFDLVVANQIADRVTNIVRDRVNARNVGLTSKTMRDKALTFESLTSNPREADGLLGNLPRFVDQASTAGVSMIWKNATPQVRENFRLFEPLGGAVVVTDANRDGRPDLFLVQAGGDPFGSRDQLGDQASDRLYLNRTELDGLQFQDVTQSASLQESEYGHGATAGDWNQDGWEDLAVSNIGERQLWINQGDGTFVSAANRLPQDFGLTSHAIPLSLAIADLTCDGIPELVEINYVDDKAAFDAIEYDSKGVAINLPAPLKFQSSRDRIYHQHPDGSITMVELPEPASTGMGLVVADFLDNGTNQIYVANDQRPNQFWSFSDGQLIAANDSALIRGIANGPNGKSQASMGITAADFDLDSTLDLHVTNFSDEWVNLFMNSKTGNFIDRAVAGGLAEPSGPMVGFGCQALDYDNDGDPDLIVANGHIEDLRDHGAMFEMPTQVFRSHDGKFELIDPSKLGDDYWTSQHLGRAVAIGDFNADGRTDAVITDAVGSTVVMENQTLDVGKFIDLQLVTTRGERSSVGAIVDVDDGKGTRRFWCQAGDGYLSRNEQNIHVGIGDFNGMVDVTVTWCNPRRTTQTHRALHSEGRFLIVEGEDHVWEF